MGFEPMISGMKILHPRPTRRTERRCCLKYLVYNYFLSSVSWIATKPSDLAKCGNFEESNNTMNKIEEKRGNRYHIRAYGTDQSPID